LSANIAHFQLIIATFAAKCVSDKLVTCGFDSL